MLYFLFQGIYENDGTKHDDILGILVRQMLVIPDPSGNSVHGAGEHTPG